MGYYVSRFPFQTDKSSGLNGMAKIVERRKWNVHSLGKAAESGLKRNTEALIIAEENIWRNIHATLTHFLAIFLDVLQGERVS